MYSANAALCSTAPTAKGQSDPPRYRIDETQWGIWRILTEHPIRSRWIFNDLPFYDASQQVRNFCNYAPVAKRFVTECYSLAPHHLLLWLLMRLITSVSGAISLFISSLLLDLVEGVLEHRHMNPRRLVIVGACRVCFSLLQWASHEILQHCERVLRERLSRHMSTYKVRVYSRLDVPTSEDAGVRSRLEHLSTSDVGWNALNGITGSFTKVLTIASQISVLLAVFKGEKGGREFAILALIQPVMLMMTSMDEGPMPHRGVFAVFQSNNDHKRMTAIKNIVTQPIYREEIVGSGLRDYFLNAFQTADSNLGDTPINDPWDSRPPSTSYWRSALPWMTYDLPWILFAAYAFTSNGSVPLKALMLLEQSVSSLTYQLQDIFRDGKTVAGWLQNLRQVYDAITINNKLVDGATPYPKPNSESDHGMKIEFKDIRFSYPDAPKPALRNLSFKVEPGQLCVIVGENGCGKSSMTKLLLRLFDPSEGQIIIDDLPIQNYKSDDLRQATSILRQSYQEFPLSIGENIGVGDISATEKDIRKAAALGNALDFIEELPNGFNTDIDGTYPYRDTLYNARPDSLLQSRVNEMENATRLSGGQWQRLALSRTFMRNKGVRLALYDEPSASLDPKAEFELFERLRAMKGKRTMMFITHRFGHLVKYADLILYLKNGTIVEQGSHEELLAADGEYAELYSLQAKAFAPPSASGDTEPEGDSASEASFERA